MKNLHIMHNEKFIAPYIEFINKNFDMNDHFFLIIDGLNYKKVLIPNYLNVEYIETLKTKNKVLKIFKVIVPLYWNLLKKISKSKKIYFHSLFDKKVILFLFVFRKFLQKSNWIIWGGDLYCYEKRKNNFKNRIWYKIEDYVKKNIGYINTLVPEDYQIAKKYYNIKGKYKRAQYVIDNDFNFLDSLVSEKKEEIYIQIGNSADPSNNHFEIIDALANFKSEKIKIFCVLSYGDKEYGKRVNEYGKKLFGNKFISIFNFMKLNEYYEYLSNIDILIFNQNRQQGLGNIFMLSYFEKKIYLRNDISSWDYLTKDLNLKINSYDKIKEETFEEFKINDSIGNKKKILETVFSEEYVKKIWEDNFKNR